MSTCLQHHWRSSTHSLRRNSSVQRTIAFGFLQPLSLLQMTAPPPPPCLLVHYLPPAFQQRHLAGVHSCSPPSPIKLQLPRPSRHGYIHGEVTIMSRHVGTDELFLSTDWLQKCGTPHLGLLLTSRSLSLAVPLSFPLLAAVFVHTSTQSWPPSRKPRVMHPRSTSTTRLTSHPPRSSHCTLEWS